MIPVEYAINMLKNARKITLMTAMDATPKDNKPAALPVKMPSNEKNVI